MSQTQRAPSNVSFLNPFRRRAQALEAHAEGIDCKAVLIAQWHIVDALERLSLDEMKHALRGAVELIDKNNGLMGEL